MTTRLRHLRCAALGLSLFLASACTTEDAPEAPLARTNPFEVGLNEPIRYGEVTADDITAWVESVMAGIEANAEAIRAETEPDFDNVVRRFDDIYRDASKAANNSFMLYWVSPDEAVREVGLESYQALDRMRVDLYSDRTLFDQIQVVSETRDLSPIRRKLVDDLMADMRHTGVGLVPADLERFKALNDELNELSSQYSNNMNTDGSVLKVDELGAAGLPEGLLSRYRTEAGGYEIPVIAANNGPVMNNAAVEETRRAFGALYANRAAEVNLEILDQLVAKRHELALIMGFPTYADYSLSRKMAQTPENVWDFLGGLIEETRTKAGEDLARLKEFRQARDGVAVDEPLAPWNQRYYRNSILKSEYGIDQEKIREYLPLDEALTGMMDLYEELLDLEFRPVDQPSVWHESVEMYEVYEDGELSGRFYLDMFPRPHKESWFYGVPLTPGNTRAEGYEVPQAMLLGNFTPASEELPSLVTHSELSTLFHEFGHIVNSMSYHGEFALLEQSRPDFVEAMSQIFENWIWEYDVLKEFAVHHDTGEVLPEAVFEQMLAAKNVGSGLSAQRSVEYSVYDMTLYNRYDPQDPMPTDDIWAHNAERFVFSNFMAGTHPQAAWIHINTHPVYMYGYLWSEVYAQDMFTQFEENGLRDTATGRRYRELIMANGTQRPIDEVVAEFLGRPSNNEAYIRSLGLD